MQECRSALSAMLYRGQASLFSFIERAAGCRSKHPCLARHRRSAIRAGSEYRNGLIVDFLHTETMMIAAQGQVRRQTTPPQLAILQAKVPLAAIAGDKTLAEQLDITPTRSLSSTTSC